MARSPWCKTVAGSDAFAMLGHMADETSDRKKIETQLHDLGRQIRELVGSLETAAGKEAEALRPKLKAAQEQLSELKQTSAVAWEDLKPGLEKAWEELHKSVNLAASRFKTPPKE